MRSGSPFLYGEGGVGGLQRQRSRGPPNLPFVIGVAGGSSSGKSQVCSQIVQALGQDTVSHKERQVYVINQDSFYKVLTESQHKLARNFKFNFDHPEAVDIEQMKSTIRQLKDGQPISVQQYNYTEHKLEEASSIIENADVVILEGILVLYDAGLRELLDIKLFVDTDSDTRLARRVIRDTEQRQRDLESVLQQYTRYTKPAFEEYCLPTKKYADVIIPRGNENSVAVSLIVQHIQDLLICNGSRRASRGSSESTSSSPTDTPPPKEPVKGTHGSHRSLVSSVASVH